MPVAFGIHQMTFIVLNQTHEQNQKDVWLSYEGPLARAACRMNAD